MKNVGYYNGRIGLTEEMMIPMNSRAVYFGDGVYDVALVKNRRFFALEDHLDRFYRSCELIQIDFTMSREDFAALLEGLLSRLDADIQDVLVYWQVSRGVAPRLHIFPDPPVAPDLLITMRPKIMPAPGERVKLITLPDVRFAMCHIKTINLLPNVLAHQQAQLAGCDEAVLHRQGVVTECSSSALLILQNGTLRTHPLDNHVLPSITRKHILAIGRELNIPVDETAFTVDEMMRADEVLVSSTTNLFSGTDEIDGVPVGGKAPELLDRLYNAYRQRLLTECPADSGQGV